MPLGDSRTAKLGQPVFTVGFPNTEIQGVEPKLTKGDINSLSGMQDDPRHFQISLPVQPGNSGGALVNYAGELVGLVTMRLNDLTMFRRTGVMPQNVNYAIKGAVARAFLDAQPGLAAKLKTSAGKERAFEDAVQDARSATVLLLVY